MKANLIISPKKCKHDWVRTAVFYNSEAQRCAGCGATRTYKKPLLD